MNFNKAIIVGRVTNIVESRKLPSGQSVTNFGVATNRVWYDDQKNKKEDVQFHNIVAFGRLADIATQYLQKGALVLIEGRIQSRTWDDKDGQKRNKTEIVAEALQLGPRPFASSAGSGQASSGQAQGYSKTPETKKPQEAEVPTVSEDDIDIEEEIPF